MPFRQRLLPKIISRKRIVGPPDRILLTVQHGSPSVASGGVQWIAMIETIAAFPGLIALPSSSPMPLTAYAREPEQAAAHQISKRADSEILNQFGPASRLAGASCVPMTSYPTAFLR
jgi:hypothetical protein